MASARTTRAVGLVCALSLVAVASCGVPDKAGKTGLYEVQVESGQRSTAAGDSVAYDLFIPRAAPDRPPGPFPAVIVTHGFARDRTFHKNNALYMARRGIVVLTPDMATLLGGDSALARNSCILIDHLAWLAKRSATAGDPLACLVDPRRIGLAGHSAGGAVAFEATLASQKGPWPAAALCLLDGTPWDSSVAMAASLKPLALASFRAEPGPWNACGNLLELLGRLSWPVEDVRIVGASHCDAENPTDLLGPLFCGITTEKHQLIYQRLTYLFFRDALQGPSVEAGGETYLSALQKYQAAGAVARRQDRPSPAPPAAPPVYVERQAGDPSGRQNG